MNSEEPLLVSFRGGELVGRHLLAQAQVEGGGATHQLLLAAHGLRELLCIWRQLVCDGHAVVAEDDIRFQRDARVMLDCIAM